ncbi:MAG: phosphoribosyltransferase, partial [Acidibacillus sp.]|nr:phosphoribosyltransferase [Acidibacillus sp.]
HKSSIAQSLAERARWREMIGNRHTNERKHQSQAIASRWHQLRTRVLLLGMVDRRSKRVPSEYKHLDLGSSKAKMMDRWTHSKSKADEVIHKQYRLAGHLYNREAFIRRLIEGQSILLIDDVLTTGGTADACAEVLYQAGAVGVHVLTIAR